MDINEHLRQVLKLASEYKQHLLTDHGELEMPPAMQVTFRATDGNDVTDMVPAHAWNSAIEANDNDTSRAVGGVLNVVRHFPTFERFIEATLVCDAWWTEDTSAIEEHGSYEKAAKVGDERIRSCVCAFTCHDDLVGGFESHCAFVPYVLDDGGVFVFDFDRVRDGEEAENILGTLTGRIMARVMQGE